MKSRGGGEIMKSRRKRGKEIEKKKLSKRRVRG